MAQILAVGNTAAQSSDFTLSGQTSSLFLTGNGPLDGQAVVVIEVKSAAGAYYPIGRLDYRQPMMVLTGPGTYRVNRIAQTANVGVDQV